LGATLINLVRISFGCDSHSRGGPPNAAAAKAELLLVLHISDQEFIMVQALLYNLAPSLF
jgi:hypothetical protein